MVTVLGTIYSVILGREASEYFPYLASGLILWEFISSAVSEGSNSLINASHLIKQIKTPIPVHILRVVFRNFIIFLHALPFYYLIYFIFIGIPFVDLLFVLLGLVLLLINVLWLTVFLSILCARFRDIPPIISIMLKIIFFGTPILWYQNDLISFNGYNIDWIFLFNPFYHLIEIVRSPMIGHSVSNISYFIVTACCFFGYIINIFFLNKYAKRIPYWV